MIGATDWAKALSAISELGMMLIAARALSSWKDEARAKREIDYLDKLTDAVHEYIQALAAPIQALKLIRLGIESREGDAGKYGTNAPVIEYIEQRGRDDSGKLWEKLGKADVLIARVKSLVARGQVYGFRDFPSASNGIQMLLWQHERLQVVASMIGSQDLNWQHPHVISALEKMRALDPADVEAQLMKYDVEFIAFMESNYRQTYSGV